MKIYELEQITSAMDVAQASVLIEQGFIAYAQGKVKVPPVQNLVFTEDNGDCCVKTAWIEGEETFTIKIATGFYDNPKKGLASNDGMMLVFSATTGEPVAMLKDAGWLTAIRTALAGRIAAKHLAPRTVTGIGILGTGQQARMQLEQLMTITDCRQVFAWGRSTEALADYTRFAESLGFNVTTTLEAQEVAQNANLIVTTTPSRKAVLKDDWIRPGTHITAVGSDNPGKQELEAALIARADLIVVDSLKQCVQYGELSHAVKSGLITECNQAMLGEVLMGAREGRTTDEQITIADLTGIAVQDAVISKCAMDFCNRESQVRAGS